MTAGTHPEPDPPMWHQLTVALLGGLTLASVLFAHVSTTQTPGLDPPPESAALFIAAASVAVVGYLLATNGSPIGYPVGALAGLVVVATTAVIATGVYGPAGPETNPIGPVAYLGLAAGASLASVKAWRGSRRAGSETASDSPR